MKSILLVARRNASAILAGLVLTIVFGAQTAQAQYRGVRPFVDCVELEYINGAATGNYTAYFGYTSAELEPIVFFSGGGNNNFFPEESPQNAVSIFYQGVHPRVISIVVPIGTEISWYLGSDFATASLKASRFCGSDGTNSRLMTYQGKLSDGAAAANGTYDLQFQLFNQLAGGAARTTKITLDNVQVTNGVFTVQLDLGANSLPPGGTGTPAPNLKLNPAILDAENSFFEIGVRAGSSTGAFTTLTPRQALTAVPLAMRANTANNAFRAANADNAEKLGGTAAEQFIRTDDGRLSNARTPTAGSSNYIQNTVTQQAGSNFNISGSGTVGGNLTVTGTLSATLPANSTSYIQNTTTQQTGNFNVSGNGTVGGTLTANTTNINGILTATTTNISGTTRQLLNVQSSSPVGTWLTIDNTTTGGRQWSVISTGASNGEGAGKLLFYDTTNATGRLLLSDAGANITGNLTVSGAISGATKNFKIDHPLDPLNKTLTYTSVESPDMMNIYNGNVTTDGRGEAIVTMPAYFEALNKDFRYQLTVIGTFAQAIVGEEIKGNTFKIKTDKPDVKVSWQITGIRHDKFAEDKQTKVEQDKSTADKGKCLYASACGKEQR